MIKITAKNPDGTNAMWIAEPGNGQYRTTEIYFGSDGKEVQFPYTYIPDNRIDEQVEWVLSHMRNQGWSNIVVDR